MKHALLISGLALAGALAGCKPPPTDAAVARATLAPSAAGPSTPLPSPDTAGAVWAAGAQPLRLVYGVPGQPVLLALECRNAGSAEAALTITRHAPADSGAGALLALIGNGAIGRIEVDATTIGERILWQGERLAGDKAWEPLAGPREITVTVPGAGLVRINPGAMASELLSECRGAAPMIQPPEAVLSPVP
ncbi:hypothetical protein [Porphyrobacter sp. AAP60]|uniref:hypothetical protein n=1 Tax=Porphyrobacter sp. AAP60 TaxID=1523423 RepID=UPI0006B8859E|nr:hypothetical protein [Porphyrobacter sp. AAP60]KPF61777.1 hypothetical protein IP79_14725 [Porphyrobacter sp. AAP60]